MEPLRPTGLVTRPQSSDLDLSLTVRARLEAGAHCLRVIGGPGYDGPLKKVADVSPDMADLLLLFPYGDVMSRNGLSLRERQICTVAMLLAHRSAQAQLRFHMRGLLNVGGTIDELVELLVVASGLLGFPPAIAGVPLIRELIQESGSDYVPVTRAPASADERFERGSAAIRTLLHVESDSYVAAFADVSPALAQWTVEFEFGDVLGRPGLDRISRHLKAVMMLAMRSHGEDRLVTHLAGAIADGVPRSAIVEALIQLSVYGGFPTALNAFGAASKAFDGPGTAAAVEREGAMSRHDTAANRRERGMATLAATSDRSGDAVVKSFVDVAPDIGAMIVEPMATFLCGRSSSPRPAS